MIERSLHLRCAPDRAFLLFTAEASAWWPASRRHTGDPESRILIDASGSFLEVGAGREVPLGRVLAWEPAARLLLDWYPGTDADHPTRVEVTFEADGEGTLVRVRHGPGPASAGLFPERAARYAASWDIVLASLAAIS